MTWLELKSKMLNLAWLTSYSNVSDTTIYRILTEAQDKVMSHINRRTDSKSFFSVLEADTEVWVSVYPNIWNIDWSSRIQVINAVKIDYWNGAVDALYTDVTEMPESLAYYRINQSELSPMYMYIGNDLHIFPKPTTAVTDWLSVYWTMSWKTITAASTDADVFLWINRVNQSIIAYCWAFIILRELNMTEEAQIAESLYYRELKDTVSNLWMVSNKPIIYELPDLREYS